MKQKYFNLAVAITSLLGYLEWSGDSKMFLFQMELEVITKLITDPTSVIHPFIIIPMLGQLLLIFTFFQKTPNKILTYLSIGGLGFLLGFMFLIGILGMNIKILLSTLPFIISTILAIRNFKKAQLTD